MRPGGEARACRQASGAPTCACGMRTQRCQSPCLAGQRDGRLPSGAALTTRSRAPPPPLTPQRAQRAEADSGSLLEQLESLIQAKRSLASERAELERGAAMLRAERELLCQQLQGAARGAAEPAPAQPRRDPPPRESRARRGECAAGTPAACRCLNAMRRH